MVGKHIIENASLNNIYQKWIDTYEGVEYEDFTQRFIHIVEELGNTVDENAQKLMCEVFVQATEFELEFFEESFSKHDL